MGVLSPDPIRPRSPRESIWPLTVPMATSTMPLITAPPTGFTDLIGSWAVFLLEPDRGFMDRAVSTDTWTIALIPTMVMWAPFRIAGNVRSPTFTPMRHGMATGTLDRRDMMAPANTSLE